MSYYSYFYDIEKDLELNLNDALTKMGYTPKDFDLDASFNDKRYDSGNSLYMIINPDKTIEVKVFYKCDNNGENCHL